MTAREHALVKLESMIAVPSGVTEAELCEIHAILYTMPEPDPQANALAAKIRSESVAKVEVSRALGADALPEDYWTASLYYMSDPRTVGLYCGIAPDGSVSS